MNHANQETNDAESSTFQIQKIIHQEIETLREFLNILSLESSLEETHTEEKKDILRQRSEIHKKLRILKQEKENLFENFFFEIIQDYEISILKDHLHSIKAEVERKRTQSKKNLKTPKSLLQHIKGKSVPKTMVTTIEKDSHE